MSVFQPEPCDIPGLDAEGLLLCDIVNGAVVGYALVIHTFNDSTRASSGPPIFLNPVTGDPYVVQGQLQLCPAGESGGLAQEVSLSAGSLAALENINATVSGTVAVSNFPASVEVSNDTGSPLPVSGSVALDAATLAALETTTISGVVVVDNFPVAYPLPQAQVDALTPVTPADLRTLTERMFAKAPVTGYALWLDTANVTHIYLAEAPVAADGTAATFRGIRVTKDATGNPLGKVQTLDGFIWDNRAAGTWV